MLLAAALALQSLTLVVTGDRGPGQGKHIVLLAGDEEYRSEEMLPQLAKILAKRHGFKCTVVFSLNGRGEIDPNTQTNQPGVEALRSADLCIMMLRFRQWPDAQMKEFVDYYLAGKPILAIRTSTHAFQYPADSASPYRRFSWNSAEWQGGFGKQVLGETWVSHWGNHGSQGTRGVPASAHPILRGVTDLFGTTDVYEAAPPPDAEILMRGEVVDGLKARNPAASGTKNGRPLNNPMMPIVWLREPLNASGARNRVMTSTFGAATDFLNPGFRRLLVNATYWLTHIPVPAAANVELVGEYQPSAFGFNKFKTGVKPVDLGGGR
jgi:hypothetical protein